MRKNRGLHKVELIKTLKKLKTEDQIHIIRFLNTEALDIIGECFHNIISTQMKLKKKDKRKLKNKLPGNERIIRYVAKKSNCPEKRRRKLLQSGGFLTTLLSVAVPFLASFIIDSVTKKR